MKYETISAFVNAAKDRQFTGAVIVDNDEVRAYENNERVCDFEGDVPQVALVKVLEALGITAELP